MRFVKRPGIIVLARFFHLYYPNYLSLCIIMINANNPFYLYLWLLTSPLQHKMLPL